MAFPLTFVVGTFAAIVGTVIMLPQVIRSLKTKRVHDVSWGMLFLYCANNILWVTYGLLIGAVPVVVSNALAFLLGLVQIILKKMYSRR